MKQRGIIFATATLVLALALPAFADPPPAPWICRDIGEPAAAGSTDVDANGVWTIRGSGDDIWGNADNFHFCYQVVRGDAQISARFLSMEIVEPSWTKVGMMVRENDTPGSPNINYCMTSGNGLHATPRYVQDESTGSFDTVGPGKVLEQIYMRLQRVGNDVAWFWSRDGNLWVEGSSSPATLPTLKEEALIGLSVTSHQDGDIAVGRMDKVSLQPGVVSVYGVRGCGGDKSVLLQWRPLRNAEGYNVYRGPAGATLDKMVKLTAEPIKGASYSDLSEDLVNGVAVTYAVSALFKAADGSLVEGSLVATSATPFAERNLPGFSALRVNEGVDCGTGASYDEATGEIVIKGSGADIWGTADQFFFMHQAVSGDFQVTVTALSKPSLTNDWSKAGLMIREGTKAGSRFAMLMATGNNGLAFQWREEEDGDAAWPGERLIEASDLKFPLVMRLTRRGDTITAEYSTDNGQTFRGGGDAGSYTLSGLANQVQVGLAITSHNRGAIAEARFRDLQIRKL